MTTICVPTLQAALPSLPTESPVWVDLTHLLRGFTSQRGAQGADAAVSAGVSDHTLDNRDRNLDPDYQDGKWHSWLDLSKRVRRGVKVGESEYSWAGALWHGHAPIAGWALNEPTGVGTAHDQVGGVNGHHGTYTGGVSLGQAGLVGTVPDTSAGLDGTNDYVEIPDWSGADFAGNAPFSILAVFNPTVIDTTYRRLVDKESPTGGRNGWAFGYQSTDGLFIARMLNGTVQQATAPASFLTAGQPNVVLATYDGAVLRLYIAGVLRGSAASTQSLTATTQVVALGRSTVFGGHLSGRLGPVYLWDVALSADDAANLYAAGQGTHYERFHGSIEELPQEVAGFEDASAKLLCADDLARLARSRVSGSRPQERSDIRLGELLDLGRWITGQGALVGDTVGAAMLVGPLGDRELDEGQVEVQAAELAGDLLPLCQEVERSEHGRFFQARHGPVRFHSRWHRLLAGSTAPVAVFGDRPDGGEWPYPVAPPHTYSKAFLHNQTSVTRVNGTEQTAEDEASILRHGLSELPPYSVTLVTDAEAKVLADYELRRRKDRRPRIFNLELDPDGAEASPWPGLWSVLANLELFDIVEVRKRPPGGGEPLVFTCEVVGITEEWTAPVQTGPDSVEPAKWRFALALAEADPGPYLVVGDGVLGLVGPNLVGI